MNTALLDQAHAGLGWPSRAEILAPSGPGASAVARLAADKLGRSLSGYEGADGVSIGVLAAGTDATEPPFAVVCEFASAVPDATLLQAQRLAWNFNRSLLLVTAEPHVIRVWSCYETPAIDRSGRLSAQEADALPASGFDDALTDHQILDVSRPTGRGADAEWIRDAVSAGLHWADLISGAFVRRHAARFPNEKKADYTLLANLRAVRDRLQESGLHDVFSHDLLARVIFVQFLFDRTDSQGRAALDAGELARLHEFGVLEELHGGLSDVLGNYHDAYALFQYLNGRFNGDLFPGRGSTEAERAAGWAVEKQHVRPEHLAVLSEFVDGRLELASGQINLWPLYAFDAIPLDLISSIYEQFVDKDAGTGIHYTPGHLVDIILDSVLPWDADNWDVRVLDPSCGSGVFLVKAYQRLVHRWRRAEDRKAIPVQVLKRLLRENIRGVDIDPGAVRVAAFSLYLAMCDEIDPRDYWSHAALDFPVLQGNSVVEANFFDEDVLGIRTAEDAGAYDIIVGNPPFGDGTADDKAKAWAKKREWLVPNNDVGTLFMAKAAELVRKGGRVGIVQSAAALLYNQDGPVTKVREKVFLRHRRIESVTVFARFPLFDDVRVPTCVVVLRNEPFDGEDFWYVCPKRHSSDGDARRVVLDQHDVHAVSPYDVLDEPWVWEVLAWGGERDRALVRRLMSYDNLDRLREAGKVTIRVGVNRGNRKKAQEGLLGRPILEGSAFPLGNFLWLDPSALPENDDPETDAGASTDLAAFTLPQLVVKHSWIQRTNRFQARLVGDGTTVSTIGAGVLCSQSYASVHGPEDTLKLAALILNSSLATYYLFLTSGRFAFDRSQPNPGDLLRVPIPLGSAVAEQVREAFDSVNAPEEVDEFVFGLFSLTETERILVEDLVSVTLRDFRGKSPKPGYGPTARVQTAGSGAELLEYGRVFLRVLGAAYGDAVGVAAEILQEAGYDRLSVRVVRIKIGQAVEPGVYTETLDSVGELSGLYAASHGSPAEDGRCITVFESVVHGGEDAVVVTLVQPDLVRYWTRSAALRDADALVADLRVWRDSAKSPAGESFA